MIACGASKQKIKAFLSKERQAPVSLKSLHNLQIKMQAQKQPSNRSDDLNRLIDIMMEVPNSKVRVIITENEELVGVFFQDERIAHVYEKFPEILFYDATHLLNNLNMPLFIQLCVDGNGDSEIVSLYVCVSESRVGVGSMIDEFKKLNPHHFKSHFG